MKDLNREHHEEKQDLINEIRNQRDELKFCKKVMALMLRPDEIARIRSKASYSDELDDWTVPAFIFKQKDLVFPKLNGMSLVNDQMDQRAVHILDQDKTSMNGFSTKGSEKKAKNMMMDDGMSSMEKR